MENKEGTPTNILLRKLRMRPSLHELIADKVLKVDYITKLIQNTTKRQTE